MPRISEEDLESLSIISEDDLIEQFALEPLDKDDIILCKDGLEKQLLIICENLSDFYDNLNIQKLSNGKLREFLILNGLKTKKDIYLFLLYRDETLFVDKNIIEELYKVIYPYYKIKEQIKKDKKLLLIDDNYCKVNEENILGYCHYKLHKGYITENLLEQHECLKKRCPLLEKYSDNTFWKKRENSKKIENNKKQLMVKEKEEISILKNEADLYVKSKSYNLIITSICKDNLGRFLIYFVTELNKNEEVKYYDIAKHLKEKFEKDFVMKKVSKSNREYATIKDFAKNCKNVFKEN